jgi:hypothetical protein
LKSVSCRCALFCLLAIIPAQASFASGEPVRLADFKSDEAAIRAWVARWYGVQTPDPADRCIMKMTIVYLRITEDKAIVHGDYGRALPGNDKLQKLLGHYVRLLEKRDGLWANTDKVGFVYSSPGQRPSSGEHVEGTTASPGQ